MAEQGASSQKDVEMEASRKFLGRMSAISQSNNMNNLDWALIQLVRKEVLSSVSKLSRCGPVQSFCEVYAGKSKCTGYYVQWDYERNNFWNSYVYAAAV